MTFGLRNARRPMSRGPRLPSRAERCNVSAWRAVWRIAMSLARRRWRRVAVVPVDVRGAWVHADLRSPLGLQLYRYGHCAVEAQVCAELLRPGDVFVDGGANIGLFALRGAAVVGVAGRVVACEPVPGTMDLLRTNVQANDFAMIELQEVALSESAGSARFTAFEPGSGMASFAPGSAGGRDCEVTVTTLDDLTRPFGDRVALVKLDIEGAEVRALQGAGALIARSTPLFLVEVEPDHLARQGSTVEDLMGVLQPHGYVPFAIDPRARLTRLHGPWLPPDPTCPNLVLASPRRSARLHGLIAA